MKAICISVLLLAGCSESGKDSLPISERTMANVSFFYCSTESLQERFEGSIEKGTRPHDGSITIFDTRNWTDGHAAVFHANRLDAASVVECFDNWESHSPEVVYKSTGKYPVYFQHVIKGGCEHEELNCSD